MKNNYCEEDNSYEEYHFTLSQKNEKYLLTFPLANEKQNILSLRCKGSPLLVEANLQDNIRVIGSSSQKINEYYHIQVKEKILATKIKDIIPLRVALEENIQQQERKEESTGLFNAAEREQLEQRRRNPNYIVSLIEKEPWTEYSVVHLEETNTLPHAPLSASPHTPLSAPRRTPHLEQKTNEEMYASIKRTIYNARVVNLSELKKLHPSSSNSLLIRAVDELTIPFLGRHILRPEYYNDLSPIYEDILKRMQISHGIFQLSPKELENQSENLLYVLNQLSEKRNIFYYLKGYQE
ncbi:hypothetical protein NEFER03_1817 [Nematocida sp. LUAm3]|nr:hypothetical protein NEFER03_1817 [Nematocida sp. LUAm3]KAI5173876.1 hypothetical protein NEFER02_0343 [Nematocida sp. LUAm2]KAI5177379.1 hypothetical protein NEFER01_0654 [Nematocida sp. LUAm1]